MRLYAPLDGQGTAIDPLIGNFSLSNIGRIDNYFMEFDQFVSSLSVDLLDFRTDGGGIVGDTVTLNVFSDLFSTNIGSTTFTITSGLPDPNLETLFVNLPANLIRSASIVHSGTDGGTAIDNIILTRKVPEPSSLLGLFLPGTLGIGLKSSCKQQE